MTDKKKRGRPTGSKGKPKTLSSFKELAEVMEVGMKAAGLLPESEVTEIAETAQSYQPSKMEAIAEVMQDVDLVNKAVDKLKSKHVHYDPYKNPMFLKKMGLKDK